MSECCCKRCEELEEDLATARAMVAQLHQQLKERTVLVKEGEHIVHTDGTPLGSLIVEGGTVHFDNTVPVTLANWGAAMSDRL